MNEMLGASVSADAESRAHLAACRMRGKQQNSWEKLLLYALLVYHIHNRVIADTIK